MILTPATVVRLVIAVLLIQTIDGCTHDPAVSLPCGYEISAISEGSPSELYFSGHDMPQQYEWTAQTALVDGQETEYYLTSEESLLSFDTEADWKAAIFAKNANPSPITPKAQNVTRFKSNDHHLIGRYDSGYFLLTFANHEMETWPEETTWRNAVEDKTTLEVNWMRNPKSLLSQTRDIRVWMFYAGVFLLVMLYPRGKKTPRHEHSP